MTYDASGFSTTFFYSAHCKNLYKAFRSFHLFKKVLPYFLMKLTAVVLYESTEMEFEISVGAGDKTFKWFGMAACQRFATQHPNGALRRRDPARRYVESFDPSYHRGSAGERAETPPVLDVGGF